MLESVGGWGVLQRKFAFLKWILVYEAVLTEAIKLMVEPPHPPLGIISCLTEVVTSSCDKLLS